MTFLVYNNAEDDFTVKQFTDGSIKLMDYGTAKTVRFTINNYNYDSTITVNESSTESIASIPTNLLDGSYCGDVSISLLDSSGNVVASGYKISIVPSKPKSTYSAYAELPEWLIENNNFSLDTSLYTYIPAPYGKFSIFNLIRQYVNKLDLSYITFGTSSSPFTSLENYFAEYYNLTSIDMSSFDTSKVTNMSKVFYMGEHDNKNTELISVDLSNIDTSKVTTMNGMFYGCNKLTSIEHLENLDTSSVTDMSYMFYFCKSLPSVDLSNFNTSSVTTMADMFAGCSSLTSINLDNFDTSRVTDIGGMFFNCSSLTSVDLSNLDLQNVTSTYGSYQKWQNTGEYASTPIGLFQACTSLNSVNLGNLGSTKDCSISSMFYGCSSLISVDLSNMISTGLLFNVFNGCSSLISVDLSNLDTSNVQNMSSMFTNCSSLTTLTIGQNWGSNPKFTDYFNLEYCPLTHDSCLDVFNKLADRTDTNIYINQPTINISNTTYNNMSSNELIIPINKGWILYYKDSNDSLVEFTV